MAEQEERIVRTKHELFSDSEEEDSLTKVKRQRIAIKRQEMAMHLEDLGDGIVHPDD